VRVQAITLPLLGARTQLDLSGTLTVAGCTPDHREALVDELVGALLGERRGAAIGVINPNGRTITVERPWASRDLATDATGADVTAEMADRAGRIRLMTEVSTLVGAAPAGSVPRGLGHLVALDQRQLWAAAEHSVRTGRELRAVSAEVGPSTLRNAQMGAIEERQNHLSSVQAASRTERNLLSMIAAVSAITALATSMTSLNLTLAPLLISLIAIVCGAWRHRAIQRAAEAEQEVLAAIGVASPLGLHIARIDDLLNGADNRRRLSVAAELHRSALEAWTDLAGTVDAELALGHRQTIQRAALLAHELRRSLSSQQMPDDPALTDRLTTLIETAAGGAAQATSPLVLVEPTRGLAAPSVVTLLSAIARFAERRQIVVITSDEQVATWAKVEAIGSATRFVPLAGFGSSGAPLAPPPPPQVTVDLTSRP
jgi:hypothetical protein